MGLEEICQWMNDVDAIQRRRTMLNEGGKNQGAQAHEELGSVKDGIASDFQAINDKIRWASTFRLISLTSGKRRMLKYH
jgi:hypothetical protein